MRVQVVMGHPTIKNHTPFASELLQQIDEEGRTQITPVVKATLQLDDRGVLVLAEQQSSVKLSGEPWSEAEVPCYKFEPETAFFKPATDVALVGHACASSGRTTQTQVTLRVGALTKTLRVTGDRMWRRTMSGISASPALPFERVALSYERAYGGWDRTSREPSQHRCDIRNPVGVGYRAKGAVFQEGTPLPNIEDPEHPHSSYDGPCTPAGFGFIGPDWAPRAALGGTYDGAWLEQRSPLLPENFQRAYHNAASPGLIAPGYLRGDEAIQVLGVQASGNALATRLPGLPPPGCRVRLRSRGDVELQLVLDTLIIDLDRRQVLLLWRAPLAVAQGLQDVAAVSISCPQAWSLQARSGGGRVIPLQPRDQQG